MDMYGLAIIVIIIIILIIVTNIPCYRYILFCFLMVFLAFVEFAFISFIGIFIRRLKITDAVITAKAKLADLIYIDLYSILSHGSVYKV